MVLDDGDVLADVSLAMQHYISVITKNGMMLNMSRDDVPYYGLSARGVKAMKLADDDYVTAVATFNIEDDLHMVSSRGHLITLKASDLPLSKRFRKGFTAIEEVKSQPHIIHYMKATPQTIKEDVILQSFSDQTSIKEPLKGLIAKDNKFGKPLFKGKKEIHLQTYINYEENDTYQQIIKDPQTKAHLPNHDDVVEDLHQVIESKSTLEQNISPKEKPSQEKTILREAVSESSQEKDIPKKTENIQRLSLFDDEDI